MVRHWARFWLQIGQVFPFFGMTSKGFPVFPPSAPVAPDLLHGVGEKGRAAGKIPAPAGIPPSGSTLVESFRTTGFTHVVGFARFEAGPVYRASLGRRFVFFPQRNDDNGCERVGRSDRCLASTLFVLVVFCIL